MLMENTPTRSDHHFLFVLSLKMWWVFFNLNEKLNVYIVMQ